MIITLLKGAEIRKKLSDNPDCIAVASSPELQAELTLHDIPLNRTGLLYCLDGNQIAVMDKSEYERFKQQEETLIHEVDNPGKSEPKRENKDLALEISESKD